MRGNNSTPPMCAEARCLWTDESALDASRYTKAHVESIFHSLRHHFPLVVLILLRSKQSAAVVITHKPARDANENRCFISPPPKKRVIKVMACSTGLSRSLPISACVISLLWRKVSFVLKMTQMIKIWQLRLWNYWINTFRSWFNHDCTKSKCILLPKSLNQI